MAFRRIEVIITFLYFNRTIKLFLCINNDICCNVLQFLGQVFLFWTKLYILFASLMYKQKGRNYQLRLCAAVDLVTLKLTHRVWPQVIKKGWSRDLADRTHKVTHLCFRKNSSAFVAVSKFVLKFVWMALSPVSARYSEGPLFRKAPSDCEIRV